MRLRQARRAEISNHDSKAGRAEFALERTSGIVRSAFQLDFYKHHRVCATIDDIVLDSF